MKLRIAVCARHVLSVGDEIGFNDDGTDIVPELLEPALSEWDQAATEAALRLRDAGHEVEIVLVSAADETADPFLRRLLAMGADRARRIAVERCPPGDAIATARLLADIIREEAPGLVLCGVLTADQGSGAVGSALAGLLDWPMAAAVKDITLDDTRCIVQRELEGGIAACTELQLPAVLTIQTGTFQPRYSNLRAIKLAEQKDLKVSDAVPVPSHLTVRRMKAAQRGGAVEILGTEPAQIAGSILRIIKESAQ